MDNKRKIEKWSARWMIIAGRAVCAGCLESQALEDCEKQFSHDPACKARAEEVKHP